MLNRPKNIIILAMLSSLISCGGGSGSTGTSAPNPEPPTDNTPTEPTPPDTAPVKPSSAETDDAAQTGKRYQAEKQFTSGNITATDSYITGFSKTGDRAIFIVNSNKAQNAPVAIRFANTAQANEQLTLYVNGLQSQQLAFPSTGEDEWQTLPLSVELRAGINTLSLQVSENASPDIYIGSVYIDGGSAVIALGKTPPYQTLEAEEQTTNAEILNKNTTYGTVQSESSQRQAVRLKNIDDYIQFTAKVDTTALTLRYSIPDSDDGTGAEKTLGLYINGRRQTLNLSSRHAWVYGAYPYSNNPSDGEAHRFYDETSYKVKIAAGDTVKLQKDTQDTASYYVLDLIETESIPAAIAQPEGYLDVTQSPYLADATGTTDATTAIDSAIADAIAQKTGVYLPAGTYSITSAISVHNVHIQGAGMWHTTLLGKNGKGGFFATRGNITLSDLKIQSDAISRRDSQDDAGLSGNFGKNSLIQNIWIEHMKVGGWIDKGTDGLLIVGGRIRDTYADGFNFHGGVINSQISQFNTRNTGDDAFAMWSDMATGKPNARNTFSHNTAQLPMLANGYAIYGGESNKLLNNIGSDTVVSSAGIAISQRFNTYPFSGTTEVNNNSLYRTGGWDFGWNTSFGSLWIFTDDADINATININNLTVKDAVYDGILVSYEKPVDALNISNTTIDGAGGFGIKAAVNGGAMSLEDVSVTNTHDDALNNWGMTITPKGDNTGL